MHASTDIEHYHQLYSVIQLFFAGHYQEQIAPWTQANLQTKVIGNDYNKEVWRVRVWSEDGKGAENPAGAQHDLAIIDGRWLLVNWSDFPKN